MKERPIIFSAPMVRAILDGHKTQTRRVMKPQPSEGWEPHSYGELHKMLDGEFVWRNEEPVVVGWGPVDEEGYEGHRCPFGQPGTRLWVREAWRAVELPGEAPSILYAATSTTALPLGHTQEAGKLVDAGQRWRSPIHMPRWASSLTLEVVCVRVERLQDITEDDARAEGITDSWPEEECNSARPYAEGFSHVWDSVNGRKPGRAWADNSWVWVIEFKQVTT